MLFGLAKRLEKKTRSGSTGVCKNIALIHTIKICTTSADAAAQDPDPQLISVGKTPASADSIQCVSRTQTNYKSEHGTVREQWHAECKTCIEEQQQQITNGELATVPSCACTRTNVKAIIMFRVHVCLRSLLFGIAL